MGNEITLISINGEKLPNPSEYKVDKEPIGEFVRNAKGEMVGDIVAIKTKISCSWGMLEGSFFKKIIAAASPFFVELEYFEPETEETRVSTFYSTPIGARLAKLGTSDKENWWRDVAFQFVER